MKRVYDLSRAFDTCSRVFMTSVKHLILVTHQIFLLKLFGKKKCLTFETQYGINIMKNLKIIFLNFNFLKKSRIFGQFTSKMHRYKELNFLIDISMDYSWYCMSTQVITGLYMVEINLILNSNDKNSPYKTSNSSKCFILIFSC